MEPDPVSTTGDPLPGPPFVGPEPLQGAIRLEDLEPLARERMRAMDADYYAGGAWDERSVAANRAAFSRWVFRPRTLVDVTRLNTSTSVFDRAVALPVLLAPTAFHALAHPGAEIETARGAAAADAVLCVSTSANETLEDIAAVGGPRWFQLYVQRDRRIAEHMVARAAEAGYEALVLTVDVPYLGIRERDVRNAFDLPPGLHMANLSASVAASTGASIRDELTALDFDPSLTWDDLEWLRELWPAGRPLLVKGVLTAEDARLAVGAGVDGVIVSNHGGRQLDGAIASLDALPEVVQAVGHRAEVFVDGGVRRGTDVLTALALGARAVMIGRPYLWGLAVGGADGVRWVLDTLRDELARAMALCGVRTVDEVSRSLVAPTPDAR